MERCGKYADCGGPRAAENVPGVVERLRSPSSHDFEVHVQDEQQDKVLGLLVFVNLVRFGMLCRFVVVYFC